MSEYLKIFFRGIWTKTFWINRWATLWALMRNPREYYKGVGKKEWDDDAYLLGITASLMTLVLSIPNIASEASYLTSKGLATLIADTPLAPFLANTNAIVVFLVFLALELISWYIELYVTYYPATWLTALVTNLMLRRDVTAKVRPVLFSTMAASLAGVIPFVGDVLAIILAIVLMVIAYDNGLKGAPEQRNESSV